MQLGNNVAYKEWAIHWPLYGIAFTEFFTDHGFYNERTEVCKSLLDLHIKEI